MVGPFSQYSTITPVQFTASGAAGPFTFTLQLGTVLPPGLSLAADGMLTGAPLVDGVYNPGIEARTASPPFYGVTTPAITVNPITARNITSGAPPTNVRTGEAYPGHTFTSADGFGTPVWSSNPLLSNVPGLGLGLNPSTGALAGTPVSNGNYQFTVRVTDGAPSTEFDEQLVNILVYTAVAVAGVAPQAWTTEAFSFQPNQTEGFPGATFTWSLQAGSLPAGLSLNTSTGEVSGTPTTVENQVFTLRVTDDTTAEFADLVVTIDVKERIAFAAQTPAAAIIGEAYSYTLVTQGGIGPFTFAITVPDLPSGLSLNTLTGEITGTSTLEQTKTFTVRVTDNATGDTDDLATSIESLAGNSAVNTLLALSPYMAYDASELVDPFVSLGSADVDMEEDPQFGSSVSWRRAPGIIRGSPATYSFMAANTQTTQIWSPSNATDANLPASTGWATGAFNCFILRFGQGKGDEWVPMATMHRSSVSVGQSGHSGFRVNENGRLYFLIGTGETGSVGNNGIRIETGDGVIDDGTPYMISAVQRGDGTGIQLLVNGVPQAVTRTIGALEDLDSFIDAHANASRTLVGPFTLNGYATGTVSSFSHAENGHGLIQLPAIWRNNPPSDAQLLELYENSIVDGPVTDYLEFLLENYVYTQDASYLHTGFLQGSGSDPVATVEWGANVQTGASNSHSRMDWAGTKQTVNEADAERTSRWPLFQSQWPAPFTGGQYIASIGSTHLDPQTTGTVNLVVELPISQDIGQARPIFMYGEGISGDDENIGLRLGGNSFGTSLVYIIGQQDQNGPTGDYYRLTVAAADASMELANFPIAKIMFTITQDGTGIRLYVNGQEVTGDAVVSSVGTTYDENGWFEQLVSPSSFAPCIGYPFSTNRAEDMYVKEFMILTSRVLTPAEVLAHWNANNGVFS